MNRTFPESLNEINTSDESTRTIADYIQYMCERVDFAFSSIRRSIPTQKIISGSEDVANAPNGWTLCNEASITLGRGTWQIIANAKFSIGETKPERTNGTRILALNNAQSLTGKYADQPEFSSVGSAVGSNDLNMENNLNLSTFVTVNDEETWYPFVYQDSGVNADNIFVRMKAIKMYE